MTRNNDASKLWINQAKEDKSSAEWLMKGRHYPQAIYMISLSIEKLLKATYLRDHPGLPVPKIHDLYRLAGQIVSVTPDEDTRDFLRELSKKYRRVRYSDLAQKDFNTLEKTQPSFLKAVKIWTWIHKKYYQP